MRQVLIMDVAVLDQNQRRVLEVRCIRLARRPSANFSTILSQNAGRSSGLRLVTSPSSSDLLVEHVRARVTQLCAQARERRGAPPRQDAGLEQGSEQVVSPCADAVDDVPHQRVQVDAEVLLSSGRVVTRQIG
jgi:hypothetical protein